MKWFFFGLLTHSNNPTTKFTDSTLTIKILGFNRQESPLPCQQAVSNVWHDVLPWGLSLKLTTFGASCNFLLGHASSQISDCSGSHWFGLDFKCPRDLYHVFHRAQRSDWGPLVNIERKPFSFAKTNLGLGGRKWLPFRRAWRHQRSPRPNHFGQNHGRFTEPGEEPNIFVLMVGVRKCVEFSMKWIEPVKNSTEIIRNDVYFLTKSGDQDVAIRKTSRNSLGSTKKCYSNGIWDTPWLQIQLPHSLP